MFNQIEKPRDRHLGSRRLALALVASMTMAASGVVYAQAPESNSAATAPVGLEEIVVTAQKFSENLQKVAIPVTAFSGATLENLGVTSAMDLNDIVPNLAVTQFGAGAQLGMRGVFAANFQESGSPTVAFMVDGVYFARQRSALSALYDIQDVEVLRGPQGTLYGRNSIAGTINVHTNQPDLTEVSGAGAIQYGNYNEFLTYGMINLPVSATLGLRGAFQTERHDGYDNNSPQAQNADDLDVTSGRVEALFKPTDSFSALLSLDFYHNGGVGGGGLTGGAPVGLYASSSGSTPFRFQVADTSTPFQNETATGATLTLNWDLPFATATYIGSIRTDRFQAWDTLAAQGTFANTYAGGYCATADSPSCYTAPYNSGDHQASQELRLSHQGDIIKWQVGVLYFRESDTLFVGIDPCPCDGLAAGEDLTFLGNDSHAVFGQVTWNVTDSLHITAGGRYNDDFTGDNGHDPGGSALAPNAVFFPEGCNGCVYGGGEYASERFHKATWRGGVDYDLTAESMLYAVVSTGYRDGGFNNGVQPDNSPFLPETITNYEIGSKNDFFDHRLKVNVDAFHALYTNYQAAAAEFANGSINLVTVNAAKAEIDGVELESTVLPTPYDRIGFYATYLHAYFTSFPLANGDQYDNYQPESLSGNRLPYAPRGEMHLSYSHTIPLADGATLVPQIETGYTSAQFEEFHNFPVSHQAGYSRTDAYLTYNAAKVWGVQLWVKNLENKDILMNLNVENDVPQQDEGLAARDGFYLPPRTYGIKLFAKF